MKLLTDARGCDAPAGGIAHHFVQRLPKGSVRANFRGKCSFQDLMERMPIQIITTRAALAGVTTFALSPK